MSWYRPQLFGAVEKSVPEPRSLEIALANPSNEMPVSDTQALKPGTYRQLEGKLGRGKQRGKEAQNAAALGKIQDSQSHKCELHPSTLQRCNRKILECSL